MLRRKLVRVILAMAAFGTHLSRLQTVREGGGGGEEGGGRRRRLNRIICRVFCEPTIRNRDIICK